MNETFIQTAAIFEQSCLAFCKHKCTGNNTGNWESPVVVLKRNAFHKSLLLPSRLLSNNLSKSFNSVRSIHNDYSDVLRFNLISVSHHQKSKKLSPKYCANFC